MLNRAVVLAALWAGLGPAATAFEVEKSWWDQRWYTGMPVDHFSWAADGETFAMKYLINQSSWKPGGPIFFYCGNEGAIEMFALNTGFMWEIAPEFGAMVVFAEHRYYGETMPYGKASYERGSNLGKLTSEQALADYAVFLTWLKASTTGAAQSPVVAFGGSYGGMLASWFRIKYPHIVVGALASSAPILQFHGVTPCNTFADIVTRTFDSSGQHCRDNIEKSWSALRRVAATEDGRSWLNGAFHLCGDSHVTASNVESVVDWLNGAWSYMAMIDYPYPTNFLNPVPGWPVRVACGHLAQTFADDRDLLAAVYKAAKVYLNFNDQHSCLSFNSSASSSLGTDGWDYQYCTEMVMPMCQLNSSMFEYQPWDFAATAKSCRDNWGVQPRLDWAMTNYGGKHLSAASNIIFSNGLLDPWYGGSVLSVPELSGEGVVVLNVTLGAHHLDLRSSHPKDPRQLRLVRNKEKHHFHAWIQEYYSQRQMLPHYYNAVQGYLRRRHAAIRPSRRRRLLKNKTEDLNYAEL